MESMSIVLTGFASGLALFAAVGAQTMFLIKHAAAGRRMAPLIVVSIVSDMLLVTLGVAGMGSLTQAVPQLMSILTIVGAVFLSGYGASALWRALRPRRAPEEGARESLDLSAAEAEAGLAADPAAAPAQGAAGARPVAAESTAGPATTGRASTLVRERSAAATGGAGTAAPATGPDAGGEGLCAAHGEGGHGHGAVGRLLRGSGTHPMVSAILALLAFTWLNPQSYFEVTVILGSMAANYGDPGRWIFAVGLYCASITWFVALGFGAKALGRLVVRYPRIWQLLDIATGSVMIVLGLVLAARLL